MIEHVTIYLAITVILGVLCIAYRRSLRRNMNLAVIDIGVWWLAFLAIYSIQPILYWLATGEFQSAATNRLEILNTSASDIAEILTISACYATSFLLAYSDVTRSARFAGRPSIAKIETYVAIPTTILFVSMWIAMRVLFSDLNVGEGYESKFLNLSESSLGMRRIHKFILASLIICGIVLIVAMLQRPRVRIFAVISIPVLVLITSPGGSRGAAFLVVLVFLVSWHVLVRPIPRIVWGGLAVLGILAFNLLGAIRSYERLPDESELLPWLVASGEFEHIFGNAVELLHAVHDGLQVPNVTRFAELFAFLPSELLGFEKTDLPSWFMETFYPEQKALGAGLAFGAMAQAVIGNGALEAIVRGLIFGTVLGLIYKSFVRQSGCWWAFPIYIYLLTRIFDSVRSSMFSFLSDFVQALIPLITLLYFLSLLLCRWCVAWNRARAPLTDTTII